MWLSPKLRGDETKETRSSYGSSVAFQRLTIVCVYVIWSGPSTEKIDRRSCTHRPGSLE